MTDYPRAQTREGNERSCPARDAVTEAELSVRRTALAAELARRRVLTDSRWVEAFTAVSRHSFLPRAYRNDVTPGGGERRSALNAEDWAAAVYGVNAAVITGLEPLAGIALPATAVAAMLQALDVDDDLTVLHLAAHQPRDSRVRRGSGDGWVTALLCHRLGDDLVYRVDAGPAALAVRDALDALGWRPHSVTATTIAAAHTLLDGRQFDRVVNTQPVAVVPAAWLHLVRPGGRVVAPVSTGVVALDVAEDGHRAHGRFLATSPHAIPADQDDPLARVITDPDARLWIDLTLDTDLRFSCAEEPVRAARGLGVALPDRRRQERRVLEAVSGALTSWRRLGEPARDRFGLTVTPSGQRVWLDHPQHVLHETAHRAERRDAAGPATPRAAPATPARLDPNPGEGSSPDGVLGSGGPWGRT